jgi:hypothetical protein
MDYLFVVTYGRSGSTLLQGVLNAIPGYLIRGENRQVMRQLYTFHRKADAERMRQHDNQRKAGRPIGSSTPVQAFYGMDAFPSDVSLELIRELATVTLLRPEEDTRVAGFKEIRWAFKDLSEYVAWLREVFPGARFVINTRALESVMRSDWWARDPESAEKLQALEEQMLDLLEELGDAAFRVHYDDFVADPGVLRGLFDWLGEPFDERKVREVLAVKHSY